MHHSKIRGEVCPVNTFTLHVLDSGIVREERQTYSSPGTSIPPDELHARQIAREAARWIAFATQHTNQRRATIQRKALDAACFSVAKQASSLAIPSKLVGVGSSDHQRRLWTMLKARVPAWHELTLDVRESEIAVLYEDERIGAIQRKHRWIRPLIPFGARLYLSKITGSERSGYTLGVNVVVGHVGHALDRLLDALGEAGYGGDGANPAGAGGDGAANHLRLVSSAPSVANPQGGTQPSPDDVVLYREIDGTARCSVEHVVRHSPTGIEWGYAGSGPADLARSILLAFTDEATADRHYQAFKADVVARVPEPGGVLRASDIRAWIARHTGADCA